MDDKTKNRTKTSKSPDVPMPRGKLRGTGAKARSVVSAKAKVAKHRRDHDLDPQSGSVLKKNLA